MNGVAKSVVFTGTESFEMRDIPLPEIGASEMLVEVELCGVDGSDVHTFRGKLDLWGDQLPMILGDEIIGRIAMIGDEARKTRGLKVGDRVRVESRWPCNECRACKEGQYVLCMNVHVGSGYGGIGLSTYPGLWGGFSTHVYVPEYVMVIPIPEGMSAKTALVATAAFANGVSWTRKAKAGPGTTMAVIGPGPQGLSCALAASAAGAKVVLIGLDRDADRLNFAKDKLGIETLAIKPTDTQEDTVAAVHGILGPDVDAVLEVAGPTVAKDLAHALVRIRGIVVHCGFPSPKVQPIDWMQIMLKDLTLMSPVGHPHETRNGLAVAQDLQKNGIDVGDWVTHVYPLEKAEEALRVAAYETAEAPIKVALAPGVEPQ